MLKKIVVSLIAALFLAGVAGTGSAATPQKPTATKTAKKKAQAKKPVKKVAKKKRGSKTAGV